jgi:hypothetical protein
MPFSGTIPWLPAESCPAIPLFGALFPSDIVITKLNNGVELQGLGILRTFLGNRLTLKRGANYLFCKPFG